MQSMCLVLLLNYRRIGENSYLSVRPSLGAHILKVVQMDHSDVQAYFIDLNR